MIRETERTITMDKDVYRVYKFPVITGSYFLKFVIEKLLPALDGIQKMVGGGKKGKAGAELSLNNLMSADMNRLTGIIVPVLSSVSQDDLSHIINTCLSYCEKQLPAGFTRVVASNGRFGVSDLEYDITTSLRLCFEVLKFNLEGFFGEGGLNLTKLPLSSLQ